MLAITFLVPNGYFVLQDKSETIQDNTTPTKLVGTYIINLDRSPDRLQYLSKSLDKLSFPKHRISAVDGKLLSPEDVASKVDLTSYKKFLNNTPNLGTIGCYLSHIKTWAEFIKSDYEFALILEDDIAFDANILENVVIELTNNKHLWDINLLERCHSGTPLTLKRLPETNKELVIYLTNVTHTGAYLINRKAALELINKSLPIKMPVDHYFNRVWEMGLIFSGVEPVVVSQSMGDSVIAKTTRISKDEYQPSLWAKIYRIHFQLQTETYKFLYNLFAYLKLTFLEKL